MRSLPVRHLALACLLACGACGAYGTPLTAAEPAPAAPAANGPSSDEVQIYLLLNRHRADRVKGDSTITYAMRDKAITGDLRNWNLQSNKPGNVPGVVFNPLLNQAAHDLLAGGAKPASEAPLDASAAVTKAGYKPEAGVATLIATDAPSLELAYGLACSHIVGATVNKTNTLSSPIFAAASVYKADLREVGIAVGGSKDHWSVIIILGAGSAKRYAGGLAYNDANHNGRCDPGEGLAGVRVTVGGNTALSSAGGAWWAALTTDDEAEVAFAKEAAKEGKDAGSKESGKGTVKLAKEAKNAVVDWRVPQAADEKAADKLLADCVKLPADIEKSRKPLAALLSGTRMLVLDPERQQKVDTLVGPVRSDYDAAVAKVLSLLAEEPDVFKKQFSDLQKRWNGAMPAFFKDAEALAKLRHQVNTTLSSPAETQEKQIAPLLKVVDKAKATSVDPAFLDQLDTMEQQLAAVTPAPKSEKGGKPKEKKK